MSLYKYLAEEAHASALVDKGQIFMRPLSYFRAYEDELVRGDPNDGKLRYEPLGGLVLTKASGEVVKMPPGWRFRASVRADDIFVYCLSSDLSSEIAAKFGCSFCVEIKDPIKLLSRISTHVRLRSKLDRNGVYSREVDYRDLAEAPGADWALPERVAFIKPEAWAWQREHRIVVGRKGAFAAENVECSLGTDAGVGGGLPAPDPLILHIGEISKISEMHTF